MPSIFTNLKWPKGVTRKARKHSRDETAWSCQTPNAHSKATSRRSKVQSLMSLKKWESMHSMASTENVPDHEGDDTHDISAMSSDPDVVPTSPITFSRRYTDNYSHLVHGFAPSSSSSTPPPAQAPLTSSRSLRRCRSSSATMLTSVTRNELRSHSSSLALNACKEEPPRLPLAALRSRSVEYGNLQKCPALMTLDEEYREGSVRPRSSQLPSSLQVVCWQKRSDTISETSLVLQQMHPPSIEDDAVSVDTEVEALAHSILLRAVAKEHERVVDKISHALDSLTESAPHITRAGLSTCALWLYCKSDGRACDVMQCLLNANANPFAYGVSGQRTQHLLRVPPFHLCVSLGMVENVDFFLTDESSENVNLNYVCDIVGETVLECAVRTENAVMVQLLIRHGAAVNATIEDAPSSADGSRCRAPNTHDDTINDGAIKKIWSSTARPRASTYTSTPDLKGVHDSNSSSNAECSTRDSARLPLLHIALAASNKDAQLILCTTLLRNGADVEARGNGGARPLHVTAQCGSVELTDLLLCWGANPTSTDESNASPLLYAASGGHTDVVRAFLGTNARVNDVDGSGLSPLLAACREHHVDIVRQLLDAHANVNARDDTGIHALFEAARCGHTDVAHLLIGASADVDATIECSALDAKGDVEPSKRSPTSKCASFAEGDAQSLTTTALREAARGGHVDCVRALLAARAQCIDVDQRGNTPLHSACERADNSTVVYALLSHLPQTAIELANLRGQRALDVALLHGVDTTALQLVRAMPAVLREIAPTVLKRLLHACLQFHVDNVGAHVMGHILAYRMDNSLKEVRRTLFFEAIRHKNLECVNHLLAHKATVHNAGRDDDGCTVLHSAAKSGMYSIFQQLFFRGGARAKNMEMKDNEGKTPVIHAAQSGNVACVSALALRGCNINAADAKGRTALHHAASLGHAAVCETLIRDYGARVDDVTQDGTQSTVLHTTAMNGSTQICELLLSYFADPNSRTSTGATPLLEAAFGGHTQACDLLIGAQADVNAADAHGITPLLDAACAGQCDTVKLLLTHGAHVDHGDFLGHTALDAAAYHGHAEVCSELLAHQADVNVCDALHWTPLLTATLQEHPHVIDVFARCSTLHWCHKDEQGLTALKVARTLENHDLVKKLCALGAKDELNSEDDGDSPLATVGQAKSPNAGAHAMDVGGMSAEKLMGQFARMWGRRKALGERTSSTSASSRMQSQVTNHLRNINQPSGRKLKMPHISLTLPVRQQAEKVESPLSSVTEESHAMAVIKPAL